MESLWYTKEKKKPEELEGISLKDYLRIHKRTRKDHWPMDKELIPTWTLFEKWGKLQKSELWNKAMNY